MDEYWGIRNVDDDIAAKHNTQYQSFEMNKEPLIYTVERILYNKSFIGFV